jgi:hypothetical protein
MLVAAALFGLSGVLGGADGRALRMLGAVVAVAGTPLLIPLTARRLGASLGASRRPSAWLAGRALVWAPRRHVRPFIGLGTLVALLFLGVGYLSAIRHTEDPPAVSSARVAAVGVSWRGGAETALDGLTRGVPHGLAVAVSADDHHQSGADHGVSHGESEEVAGDDAIRLAATCPELAATGLRLRCHAADPHRISATESRALGLLIGRTFSDEPAPVRLVSRAGLGEPVTRAVVLGTVPTRELDERVRASANAVLSAPSVTSVENNRPVHTRAATWIGGGFAAAGTLLSIAALIAIVDRLLGSRRSWRQLLNIGLTRRGLARLDLQLLVQPWLAAVGTGSAVGSVAALALGDPGQGYPWGGAVLVVAGVALLTVLAGVLAFALAQRAALPERE